ncbi:MAG: ATP-dependent Clp protease adaptor ClpS [Bacteroidales bacterium]|nr:ATP-dependent Clp protease adaptor ClpS [Bacteroidales bacterium]
MGEKEYIQKSKQSEELLEQKTGDDRHLILHNDDVHTFDYVIESLVKVCELEPIQAEQCTYLVHYKGKCDVKKGDFDFLHPYKNALIERGLEATID